MTADGPQLTLAQRQSYYEAGDALAGTFSVGALNLEDLKAVELSVLWYTEGKGDEDMAVHHFQRFEPASEEWRGLNQHQSFSTRLPNSPLSYAGVILKIRWCVRLRVFMRRGKDAIVEIPFQFGAVPAAPVV